MVGLKALMAGEGDAAGGTGGGSAGGRMPGTTHGGAWSRSSAQDGAGSSTEGREFGFVWSRGGWWEEGWSLSVALKKAAAPFSVDTEAAAP